MIVGYYSLCYVVRIASNCDISKFCKQMQQGEVHFRELSGRSRTCRAGAAASSLGSGSGAIRTSWRRSSAAGEARCQKHSKQAETIIKFQILKFRITFGKLQKLIIYVILCEFFVKLQCIVIIIDTNNVDFIMVSQIVRNFDEDLPTIPIV